MCFSPKIKTPKVDTNQVRAVDPAPLTEEPKGILFGGDDEETIQDGVNPEVPTGSKKSLKVKLDSPSSKTLQDDKSKKTGARANIRKSLFQQ
jgi:hypothetical protein